MKTKPRGRRYRNLTATLVVAFASGACATDPPKAPTPESAATQECFDRKIAVCAEYVAQKRAEEPTMEAIERNTAIYLLGASDPYSRLFNSCLLAALTACLEKQP